MLSSRCYRCGLGLRNMAVWGRELMNVWQSFDFLYEYYSF
jgi:hypothetical protein